MTQLIFDRERKAVEKLRKKRQKQSTLKSKEIKEANKILSLVTSTQARAMVDNLKALRKKTNGQKLVNQAVRNFITDTGGYKVQKNAKIGLNPSIQKKQGFIGATAKAGGGKVKKKK